MKHLKFLAFASVILVLAACENLQEGVTNAYDNLSDMTSAAISDAGTINDPVSERLMAKGSCPVVEIEPDLAALYDFGGMRPSAPALVTKAVMTVQSTCAYSPKSVTVDARLTFNGFMGNRGRQQGQDQPVFSYPYFVAIVAPGGRILAKEVFGVSMSFPPGTDIQNHIEGLRQIIPIYNQESGMHHKILIGFQLTKDQLAYNRVILKQRTEAQKARAEQDLKRAQEQQQRRDSMLLPHMETQAPVVFDADAPPGSAAAAGTAPIDNAPTILTPNESGKKLNQ